MLDQLQSFLVILQTWQSSLMAQKAQAELSLASANQQIPVATDLITDVQEAIDALTPQVTPLMKGK
jgi:hypothetical protein